MSNHEKSKWPSVENGPSLEWLIRNRIIRAKEQVDSCSALLAMVEKGDMPADVQDMLIKLLLATRGVL